MRNPVPVNITQYTFSNSVNAKLYVPIGSKGTYEAADYWKDFKEIVEMEAVSKDDFLNIGDVEGFTGKQMTMPIALKNTHQITGLQMDLYLPEGVTVATNSRGKLVVTTTERMDGNYTLTGNVMDGFVRIVGYSADSDAFTGEDGDILNVTLDIAEDLADGDYAIKIKDIVLSDVNSTEYHPADVEATLTVKSYTLGDVDDSGAININDVVWIINYILNRTNGTFIPEAADVDGSGSININDVVTLINRFILHRESAPKRAPRLVAEVDETTDHLYLADVCIEPGESLEIAMQLANEHEVKAVQGNIKLPAGLHFVTKSNGRLDVRNLDERSEDFTLSCALQEDGSMTFAHYSADGFAYEGTEGGIFTFKVAADTDAEYGLYDVRLSDVVLSINGVGYELPALVNQIAIGQATAIVGVEASSVNQTCFTLDGRRTTTPLRGINIVRKADGGMRKMVVK